MSRIADEASDMERPFVDNLARFDNLSEKISEEIDMLGEYVEILNEYKAKMGTPEDTRSMRNRMNKELTEGNELIKRVLELFQELEEIRFKKKKDIDNYNKMCRRLNNTFNETSDKFTKVLKEIHSREKIFLQVRQASVVNVNNSFSEYTGTVVSSGEHPNQENGIIITENGVPIQDMQTSGRHSIQDHSNHESVIEVASDIELYASIIKEREAQVDQIAKLAAEMNMFAQAQANLIAEQSGDIENLVEYTTGAEKNTEEANKELDQALKYQKKATKRNLWLTLIIVFCCVLVAIIVFSVTS